MYIKLAKISFVLMFFYHGWYQDAFVPIPRMLLILGAPMVFFIFLHYFTCNLSVSKAMTKEIGLWLLFILTSYFSGIFIAQDTASLVSSVTTLLQFFIVFTAVIMIADEEKNVDFFIKIYIVLSLLCALTAIIAGQEYRGRMSFGEQNPNTLGLLMCNGIVCTLYLLNFNNRLNPVLSLSGVLVFFYVIIQTGSRKAFLAAILLIIFWLLFVFRDALSNTSTLKKVVVISVLLTFTLLIYLVIIPLVDATILLARLDTLMVEGDPIRVSMIVTAMEYFAENPLFGIGYDQFREISVFKAYSHSTYAEILACTGIIGALSYFSVYLVIIYKLIKVIMKRKETVVKLRAKLLLAQMMVMIFLAASIIHFYRLDSMIMFGMIIAFCNQNLKNPEGAERWMSEKPSCDTSKIHVN